MILWREVKKAILNPLRTGLTCAPASLVNNKRVWVIDRGVQDLLRKLQTLLP